MLACLSFISVKSEAARIFGLISESLLQGWVRDLKNTSHRVVERWIADVRRGEGLKDRRGALVWKTITHVCFQLAKEAKQQGVGSCGNFNQMII